MRRFARVLVALSFTATPYSHGIAQSRATPTERRAADSSTRSRDSIAYFRYLSSIDSLARLVPTDSLRALYRAVSTSADPLPAWRGIICEAYRLSYAYGDAAAGLAEDRVRAAEWTPDRDSAVYRAYELFHRPIWPPFWLPTRDVCGVHADTRYFGPTMQLVDPRRPRFFPEGSPRDSLRLGDTYFEATVSSRSSRDTVYDFAGTALLGEAGRSAGLVLSDRTRTDDITVFYFGRSGYELWRAGTYPVFNSHEFWQTPSVPNVVGYYGQSKILPGVGVAALDGKVWGTLQVDRADTSGIEGRLDAWVEPGGLASWRERLRPGFGRDTLRIQATFRARYNRSDGAFARTINHQPLIPHRLNTSEPAPSAESIVKGMFLDEHVPCEQLPIYSPASMLSSLPASYPRASAWAQLSVDVDTGGRARQAWFNVWALEDTSLAHLFSSQTGIRFRRTAPGQFIEKVRCTLTLRRAP